MYSIHTRSPLSFLFPRIIATNFGSHRAFLSFSSSVWIIATKHCTRLPTRLLFFSPAFVFYYCFRRSFSPRFKLSILFPLNYYNIRSNVRKYRQSCFIQPCTFFLRCFFYYNDSIRRALFLPLLLIQATSARVSRASIVLPPPSDGVEEQAYVHIRKFRHFAARNRSLRGLSTLADLET